MEKVPILPNPTDGRSIDQQLRDAGFRIWERRTDRYGVLQEPMWKHGEVVMPQADAVDLMRAWRRAGK